MVREVEPEKLSPEFPWFVPKCVKAATHDVTIACVGGRLFAYELSRSSFKGEDCRFPTTTEDLAWTPCALSPAETTAVRDFMKATGFTFGRIDMLRDADGLWFLEVNPNGQFAWLDPFGENGLLDAVADEIRQVHQRHKSTKRTKRKIAACS